MNASEKTRELREGIEKQIEPYAFSGTITSSDGYYFFADKLPDLITAILSLKAGNYTLKELIKLAIKASEGRCIHL